VGYAHPTFNFVQVLSEQQRGTYLGFIIPYSPAKNQSVAFATLFRLNFPIFPAVFGKSERLIGSFGSDAEPFLMV
jgi:hypothetical protein